MHELASCFCPYQLYPHDTLCTYGVKQFDFTAFYGGPEGIRTHDLTDANRTLSQLSYRPKY